MSKLIVTRSHGREALQRAREALVTAAGRVVISGEPSGVQGTFCRDLQGVSWGHVHITVHRAVADGSRAGAVPRGHLL